METKLCEDLQPIGKSLQRVPIRNPREGLRIAFAKPSQRTQPMVSPELYSATVLGRSNIQRPCWTHASVWQQRKSHKRLQYVSTHVDIPPPPFPPGKYPEMLPACFGCWFTCIRLSYPCVAPSSHRPVPPRRLPFFCTSSA